MTLDQLLADYRKTGMSETYLSALAVAYQLGIRHAPVETPQAQPAFGYALAMRVLQSDLYHELDDLERGECDALIVKYRAQPAESPDAQQMDDDLMRHGVAVSLGGKRIDPAELYESPDALDAARYRWLREQHWSNANICCVLDPKENIRLGGFCPSEAQLDAALDAAMKGKS